MDIELSSFHLVLILFIKIKTIPLYDPNKLYFAAFRSILKYIGPMPVDDVA